MSATSKSNLPSSSKREKGSDRFYKEICNKQAELEELESTTDLEVICEQDNRATVRCHKVFLCLHSEIFRKQLSSDTKCIVVSKCTSIIFRLALKFLYTGRLSVKEELDIVQLRSFAIEYEIDLLTEWCREYALESFATKNIFLFLEKFKEADDFELIHLCGNFILRNAESIMIDESFLNLTIQSLSEILECAGSQVESEDLNKFLLLKAWANNEGQRRKIVQPLLEKIRFTRLTTTEYDQHVKDSHLLPEGVMLDHVLSIGKVAEKNASVKTADMNKKRGNKTQMSIGTPTGTTSNTPSPSIRRRGPPPKLHTIVYLEDGSVARKCNLCDFTCNEGKKMTRHSFSNHRKEFDKESNK